MKKIIITLTVCLIVFACKNNSAQEKTGFFVSGKIANAGSTQISIQELTSTGLVLLDTATLLPDGSFELNGKLSEKTFCTIRMPQGDIILLVDTNSNLVVNADANNLENYTLVGNDENEDLRKLFMLNNSFMKAARNIEQRFNINQNEVPSIDIQNKLRFAFDSLQTAHKKAVTEFSIAINNSLVPYFTANFLMPEADFEFFNLIDEKLFPQFSQSKYAISLHQRVGELKKTAIGQVAPDIILSDPFGKQISLHSFRGKYVLVDFWAAWCGPCRKENPNVVRLFNKYKSKGFDVFGVSLDDNRDAWVKAINDDKLLWNHGSDLLKWNSSVVKLYNIEGIPFAVLLDKEGKIIGKNLRGEALEKKLQEIFGF